MRTNVTAKVRINPTEQVIDTIKAYTKALQFCVDYAWKHKITQNFKLHYAIYQNIRQRFKLPAQIAVVCMRQACGMVKKAKSKPIIKRTSVRFNFPRSANIKGNKLVLRLLKCRQEFNLNIPECYAEYFKWDVSESLLRMDKKGRCFFLFTFSKEVTATKQNIRSQNRVLGIDLGINNLAVTSDGRFYNSAKVKQVKRKFKYLRSELQSKGTRSAKRLLRKLSGRETRWIAWINHNISKDIVSHFNGNKIVMENLKGIRKANRWRKMNYWISNWSFYQLQSFIKYKAERKGIEVIRVKPNYTSQICHKCGQLGSRLSGCFSCSHCRFSSYSADLNAARNLAHPMLVERQGVVTHPHDSGCDAEGNSQVAIEAELRVKSPTL
ncbi:MAG TPA: transposase [Candidatus Nanoarchaeia archaeon]|nr:transposase [Candidatus Nanoarchaeia archaeon]